MKKFYVVGDRVSTSLSPIIFNYWFKKYKIKAQYDYLETNNKNFDKKIKKTLSDESVSGLNITIPFKKKIMGYVDSFDEHSKKIGAVNCVSVEKRVKGINTDWIGYYKTLPKKTNLKNKKILILGYGGAALAIHYVLTVKKFKHIIIINRTKKKLAFNNKIQFTKNISKLGTYLKKSDVIINTTPINPIDKKLQELVNSKTLISDIVYKPKETEFLKTFPNNKKIYGISMLLQQAIPAFKFWFKFSPVIDSQLVKILEKKIK